MSVAETRRNASGLRRRRRCDAAGCDGRLTTQEMIVGSAGRTLQGEEHILFPRKLAAQAMSLAAELSALLAREAARADTEGGGGSCG